MSYHGYMYFENNDIDVVDYDDLKAARQAFQNAQRLHFQATRLDLWTIEDWEFHEGTPPTVTIEPDKPTGAI